MKTLPPDANRQDDDSSSVRARNVPPLEIPEISVSQGTTLGGEKSKDASQRTFVSLVSESDMVGESVVSGVVETSLNLQRNDCTRIFECRLFVESLVH